MHAKVMKITVTDIVRMTGLGLDTVRRHQRNGVFDLKNPDSVFDYVSGHKLLRRKK